MARGFALILGGLYLLGGLLGFVPAALAPLFADPDLHVTAFAGRLLGEFPVNAAHSALHLLVGAWGLLASAALGPSLIFARGIALLFGLLTLLGVFRATETLMGLMPIYGNDVWLHGFTALLAVFVGWVLPLPAPRTGTHAAPNDGDTGAD